MRTKITVLVLLRVIHIINGQRRYVGAVVEYSPKWNNSKTHVDNLMTNAKKYKVLVTSAKKKGASIVVFPEYGLTTRDLPEPLDDVSFLIPKKGNLIPQGHRRSDEVLEILSNVAKELNIYVVVNLIEKSNSSDKTCYHNTNVVFDRSGEVIARYRKINLHNEAQLTPGVEHITFLTDFGVTFGILISDDILFKNPAKDILNTPVTDVIYSTAWYSERPMLTAISIQDGYSKASGVNLLASGLSNPSKSLTGSGIYYANSTVADVILSTVILTLPIIKDIPVILQQTPGTVCDNNVTRSPRIGSVPNISAVITSSENFKHYTFQDLNTNGSQSVCSKDFCCNFNISGNYTKGEYKLGAFSGVRKYHETTIGVEACVLVACERNSGPSCEVVKVGSELHAQFKQISISGNFSEANDTFYQPSTLTSALRPTSGYSFCRNGSHIQMVQTNPQDSLLSFGIFGRVYDYDGREEGAIGHNGNERINSACVVLLLACMFRLIVGQ